MEQLRAVIYCRCSTEEESQADALKKQEQESIACVLDQGWLLVDKYVEAKSGTTIRGRDEYQRLYDDLQTEKFGIIVIKSQDRLMRNVKDWYLFLDKLVSNGKQLFIYLEHKFYSSDDALISGIKAILAEDYSRELSKKINNAHRNRQKNGGKSMLTSRTFGYKKMSDGAVCVVDEEAEIIKMIYDLCIAGYGSRAIANILRNQGYVSRSGESIAAGRILRMIRNPIYTGTMIMNKKHYDFDAKKTIKNPPKEWIYQRGATPAIIDEETWKKANIQVDSRSGDSNKDKSFPAWSKHGEYQLSGKLVCAECGNVYYRVSRRGYANPEKKVIEWKCSTYLSKGRMQNDCRDKLHRAAEECSDGCNNIHLDEKIVFSLLGEICGSYLQLTSQNRQRLIDHTVQLLQQALKQDASAGELDRLEGEERHLTDQKDLLLSKLLEAVITDEDYKRKREEIESCSKIIELRKDELRQIIRNKEKPEKRIAEIWLELEHGGIEKIAVARMLEDIDRIIVHPWHLEVHFDQHRPGRGNEKRLSESDFFRERSIDKFVICMDYPFPPATERGRLSDRIKIVQIMEKTPQVTAKQIAVQLERTVKMIQSRIAELRKAGYIEYCGAGGHGTWKVLRPPEELKGESDTQSCDFVGTAL